MSEEHSHLLRSGIITRRGILKATAGTVLTTMLPEYFSEISIARERFQEETKFNNLSPLLFLQIGHGNSIETAVFSSDGKQILTAGDDSTARVWDIATGKEIKVLKGHLYRVTSASFSKDNRRILTSSYDKTVKIWDIYSGNEVSIFRNHDSGITSSVFSEDEKYILTGSRDGYAKLWDIDTLKEVITFGRHDDAFHREPINSAVFSPDGKQILTAGDDNTARLWDVATGKELFVFRGHSEFVESAIFSPDGKRILTASFDKTARLWDFATGKELFVFKGHDSYVCSAVFSPDGKKVLTASSDKTAKLWDVSTGKEVVVFNGHTDTVKSAVFSPDGKKVLTASYDNTARIWGVSNSKELFVFKSDDNDVELAVFSPDGQKILTVIGRKFIMRRNDDYKALYVKVHEYPINSVVFSSDSKKILTSNKVGDVMIWDIDMTKETMVFVDNYVLSAVFSSDNKKVLTSYRDGTARIRDAGTGKEYLNVKGHGDWVNSLVFSFDDKRVLTAGFDGRTRLWDASTGKEICVLVSFRDGTWAVTDSEGRYDASSNGDVNGLHWVIGLTPIPLNQLKSRYYDPGLLAKKMGFNKEPLRDVQNFENARLHPEVTVAARKDGDSSAVLTLTNRGGGIGEIYVTVNGKRQDADPRAPRPDANAPKAILNLDLKRFDALCEPGKPNKIEVFVKNADGTITSRGVEIGYVPPIRGGEATPPRIHALVAGVSNYRGESLDLKFAAKDAQDFAKALEVVAQGNQMPLSTTLLYSPRADATETVPPDKRPSRANLLAALDDLKKLKPEDILVLYLSGHGKSYGDLNNCDYYYLTESAATGDLADPAVRQADAVSGTEIAKRLALCPAKKQFVILDTCASGKGVERLAEGKDISGSMKVSWENMRDRSGVFLLAGCAGDAVSYEATRYGQGLLTYSLLEAIHNGSGLREGGFVDVDKLCQSAASRVDELARTIKGVQKPIFRPGSTDARTFDLGRITGDSKKNIPLARPLPVFVRSTFQLASRPQDPLGLTLRVDEALREATITQARSGGASFVFWDVAEAEDSYQLGGRYTLSADNQVTIEAALYQKDKEVKIPTITGKRLEGGAPEPKLVEQLLAAVRKALPAAP